jgi:hypothetical protein
MWRFRTWFLFVMACSSKPNDHVVADAELADAPTVIDSAISHDAPGIAPLSCTGLAYCESFESYPAGALTNKQKLGPWTVNVDGTVTLGAVDGVKPYSGAQSLHVTVPAGSAAGVTLLQASGSGLVAGNDLYGRAMVYFSNAGSDAAPVGCHSWLFQALGSSAADGGDVSMNWGDIDAKMELNYHPNGSAEETTLGSDQMSAGAWHCVQWQFDGGGSPVADVAKLWVDGVLVDDVEQSVGWEFATPWSSFNVGFTHFQTLAAGADVYLDDFALGSAMISCPQ